MTPTVKVPVLLTARTAVLVVLVPASTPLTFPLKVQLVEIVKSPDGATLLQSAAKTDLEREEYRIKNSKTIESNFFFKEVTVNLFLIAMSVIRWQLQN